MPKPLIGITLDIEPQGGGYSSDPWYALRVNYAEAVSAAGGLPVALPHELGLVEDYLERIDALLVSGGMFDIPPELYTGQAQHQSVTTKANRTAFELALLRGALARDMPVLGICGGMQLLVVASGGTLYQDIGSEMPGAFEHMQSGRHDEPWHAVDIEPGSELRRLLGCSRLQVNSVHHQGAHRLPESLRVAAQAEDGLVEAIERIDRRFAFGLQWHPEYHINPEETALFRAFVAAARQ